MFVRRLNRFLQQDYAIGVLLFVASALAMIAANIPFIEYYYDLLLATPVSISVGAFEIHKPLLLWINDGLMALFFLLVGLEVKQEIMEGNLSTPAQVVLPGVAALGGMVVPALCYLAFNYNDPLAARGWAIPAATDIAFAVGILALLGKRAPPALMSFLLALAIIDDLGAIIIIALFYTEELSVASMVFGSIFLSILVFLNYRKVASITPYLFFGALLWVCVLKSGVHATLAGVLLAFTIPLKVTDSLGRAPLKYLQHSLHNKVHYYILPVFAFANAGIELNAQQIASILTPIPVGIATGLFIGKQAGVFCFSWVAVKVGIARLPKDTNWVQMYGLAMICGIGFTMSLFIGSLAFENAGPEYLASDRVGILVGSIFSAAFGFALLFWAGRKRTQ